MKPVKQKMLITLALVALLNFFLLIVFGNGGFTDYLSLKAQKEAVLNENEALVLKTISLYHQVERLEHDPRFVEHVIRKELGVVGKTEIIFKKALPSDESIR